VKVGICILNFKDLNRFDVDLMFEEKSFNPDAGHVLIVLKHEGKWLLTINPNRGNEFPGGKREVGESIEEAAIRETYEETGVTIINIKAFAQYIVYDAEPFYKTVFTGQVLHTSENYERHETDGALWLTDQELDKNNNLSFFMKDEGMDAIRKWVINNDG